MTWIEIKPDQRFIPICYLCKTKIQKVHSETHRIVRDLSLTEAKVFINLSYRKLYCPSCEGIRVEDLEFVEPYVRVTRRLTRYIHDLCKIMTIKDVADHLDLDWRMVKSIDKYFLEEEFSKTDYRNLHIIAIDEISVRKGHRYLTVVLDYETGHVVWMGEERTKETLDTFFEGMTEEEKDNIEAVAMDIWRPYIDRVKHWCPKAKIVFDLFHVVKEFNKVIDITRNTEYRKANEEEKRVIQGIKIPSSKE